MISRAALSTGVASFFITLSCASFNSWGLVALYISSHFHSIDPDVTLYTTSLAYSIGLIFFGASQSLCPYACERIGVKLTCFIGAVLLGTGYLLCSFVSDVRLFIVCFAFFVGSGSGLSFLTGSNVLGRHFKQHRGKAIGLAATGYGLGSLINGLLYAFVCNPYNESPTVEIEGSQIRYFSEAVGQNVPTAFRIVALMWFCSISLGAVLITPPALPSPDEEEEILSVKEEDEESVWTALKTVKFWKMYALLQTGMFSCIWINLTFKNFGSLYIKDDHLLAYIGSASAAMNSVSRLIFPFIIDYLDFFSVNMCVLCVLALANFSIYFAVANSVTYAACVCTTLFCMGAQFFPFSILCMRVYGTTKGPKVFSFLLWAAVSCGMISTPYYTLVEYLGYGWTYWIQGILCISALSISYSMRAPKDKSLY
jgi:MFS family permease